MRAAAERRRLRLVARLCVGALVLGATGPAAGSAESSGADRQNAPTFGAGTARVLLDVVVRDRKGRPARGLQAADFEVFEDGAKQTVDSFREVASASAVAAPAEGRRAEEAASSTSPADAVVAFVFDAMSASGRDMAHKAALAYLADERPVGDVAAVFVVEGGLRVVEGFTRDRALLAAAFERALKQGNASTPADDRAGTRDLVGAVARSQIALPRSAAGTSVTATIGETAARGATDLMQVHMTRTFEALERDAGGHSTINALLAVVNGLSRVTGRKTLILFSEGLVIPSNVEAPFRSVIASANRANVSVYAMDAGGLRAESESAEARREFEQAALRRMMLVGTQEANSADGDMMRQLERNEDLLRLDPSSGLGQLAEGTGGFLVRGTNDAGVALDRIEEDARFYYLLSYTPTHDAYDGTFRSISVKVRGPGLQVQARRGYFALRPSDTAPVLAYEAPALAALDRTPGWNAFPLGIAALSFPEPDRPGLAPVVVQVPEDAIACAPRTKADKTQDCGADFAVVVRIKDAEQREVDRLARHYLFASSANPRERRRGGLVFYREANLPPGRYSVEAVGYDAVSRKASVRRADLAVREAREDRLRLSSLVLVTRADPLPADRKAANPLCFGDTVLYPSTGEPLHRGATPSLAFYFTTYGAGSVPPKATIAVLRDGRELEATTVDLPAPDSAGRIQYAGALPLASLASGSYTLRVTATDARGADSSATPFTLVE